MKKAIENARPKTWQFALPGLVAAIAVTILGFYFNRRLQRTTLAHETQRANERHAFEQRMESKRAGLQALKDLVQWRARQIEELYGPLRALLGQSKGVTDLLHHYLHKEQAFQYGSDWISDPESTSGKSFQVRDQSGGWHPFRLLQSMPQLYGDKRLHIDPLVSEIVAIGKEMVKIIRSKSGLILDVQGRPGPNDEPPLPDVFARYLAHYAFLKECYLDARDPNRRSLARAYDTGYYPRKINKLIEEGYVLASNELADWQQQLKDLADDA